MTSFLITATETAAQSLGSFETGVITATGTLATAAGSTSSLPLVGVSGQGIGLIVEGDILSRASAIATTGSATSALTLRLGEGGSVRSHSGDAVRLANMNFVLVENLGAISGGSPVFGVSAAEVQDGDALRLYGAGASTTARLVNDGHITGTSGGGIEATDFANVQIQNGGTIRGMGGDAIEIVSGVAAASLSLYNSGLIAATPRVSPSSSVATAITVTGATATIVNSGTIQGSIVLGLGDDILRGATGTILGEVTGGAGNDQLRLGLGANTATGDAGNDSLWGGEGEDRISGGDGGDLLWGGADADSVLGGAGSDALWGGADDDSMDGGIGGDTLVGGAGEDSVDGGAEGDRVFGNGGDDSVFGQDGADSLWGGDGDDAVYGGAGADRAHGGLGHDTIWAGGDADILFGQFGGDTLVGEAGADELYGGEDDDLLSGQADNDVLVGGGGDDVLAGGAGADRLFGGAGADLFDFNAGTESTAAASDTIFAFQRGQDLIDLTDLSPGTLLFVANGSLSPSTGSVRVAVTGADTTVTIDTNGTSNAGGEMRIVVVNINGLAPGDFLF